MLRWNLWGSVVTVMHGLRPKDMAGLGGMYRIGGVVCKTSCSCLIPRPATFSSGSSTATTTRAHLRSRMALTHGGVRPGDRNRRVGEAGDSAEVDGWVWDAALGPAHQAQAVSLQTLERSCDSLAHFNHRVGVLLPPPPPPPPKSSKLNTHNAVLPVSNTNTRGAHWLQTSVAQVSWWPAGKESNNKDTPNEPKAGR